MDSPQTATQAEMIGWVAAMDSALLSCLPARELQAADHSGHASHHVDVECHAKEFMESVKKLQMFFTHINHEYEPRNEERLKKEIIALETELKAKDELIEKQSQLIQTWKSLLISKKNALVLELEKV